MVSRKVQFVIYSEETWKFTTMWSFVVYTKDMCNLLCPLFNEHLPPSSDSCCADRSSSSTGALGVRFLQQSAMTLGLKNVGHLERNLPDTSSPKIIVKSWSILNRKKLCVCENENTVVMVLWVSIHKQSTKTRQPQNHQQFMLLWFTKPGVSKNLGQ